MKKYDLVKYNNYEWYIIDIDNDKVILFLKDILSKEEMQELFDEDLLDDDKDVRFNYDYKNWRWSDSPIRQVLNTKWLSKFNKNELEQMKTEIEFNNEKMITNDFVRLLSYEESQKIPLEILKSSGYGYWLGSPSLVDYDDAFVRVVGSSGASDDDCVDVARGVRPAVSVKLVTGTVKLVTGTVTPLKPEQNECEPSHEYNINHNHLYYKNEEYKLTVPQKLLFDEMKRLESRIERLENEK